MLQEGRWTFRLVRTGDIEFWHSTTGSFTLSSFYWGESPVQPKEPALFLGWGGDRRHLDTFLRSNGDAYRFDDQSREYFIIAPGDRPNLIEILTIATQLISVLIHFAPRHYEYAMFFEQGDDVPPERVVALLHLIRGFLSVYVGSESR